MIDLVFQVGKFGIIDDSGAGFNSGDRIQKYVENGLEHF